MSTDYTSFSISPRVPVWGDDPLGTPAQTLEKDTSLGRFDEPAISFDAHLLNVGPVVPDPVHEPLTSSWFAVDDSGLFAPGEFRVGPVNVSGLDDSGMGGTGHRHGMYHPGEKPGLQAQRLSVLGLQDLLVTTDEADYVGLQYQVNASPVENLWRPRWQDEQPLITLTNSSGLVRNSWTAPEHDPLGLTWVAAFVIYVPVGLMAAASVGTGPLVPVWHSLFG